MFCFYWNAQMHQNKKIQLFLRQTITQFGQSLESTTSDLRTCWTKIREKRRKIHNRNTIWTRQTLECYWCFSSLSKSCCCCCCWRFCCCCCTFFVYPLAVSCVYIYFCCVFLVNFIFQSECVYKKEIHYYY